MGDTTYLDGVKHCEMLYQKGYSLPELHHWYNYELWVNGNLIDEWLEGFLDCIPHLSMLEQIKRRTTMLKPEDIKVGTKLEFIDDGSRVDFIVTGGTDIKRLIGLYNAKGYFEVFDVDFADDFIVGDSYETDYIYAEELRYFKIVEPALPEQAQLSEAVELIKELISGHEYDSDFINSGIRMRSNKFLRSIGNK